MSKNSPTPQDYIDARNRVRAAFPDFNYHEVLSMGNSVARAEAVGAKVVLPDPPTQRKRSWIEFLDQSTEWKTGMGNTVKLTEMEDSHLENLLKWLCTRGATRPEFHQRCINHRGLPHPSFVSYDLRVREMKRTPLARAVKAELLRRRSIEIDHEVTRMVERHGRTFTQRPPAREDYLVADDHETQGLRAFEQISTHEDHDGYY